MNFGGSPSSVSFGLQGRPEIGANSSLLRSQNLFRNFEFAPRPSNGGGPIQPTAVGLLWIQSARAPFLAAAERRIAALQIQFGLQSSVFPLYRLRDTPELGLIARSRPAALWNHATSIYTYRAVGKRQSPNPKSLHRSSSAVPRYCIMMKWWAGDC